MADPFNPTVMLPGEEPYPTPQEVEELFRRMRSAMEEYTRTVQEGIKGVGQEYTEMMRKSTKELATEQSLREFWFNAGEMIGAGIAEATQKSLQRSLPGELAQLEPGFGKLGEQLGGGLLGGLVFATTGSPALAQLGRSFGSTLTKAVSMQLEGYEMIGARVAPQARAGFEMPTDFDKVGREYRQMIMELGKETGASADQIAKLVAQLSRVGVGFLEGGRDAAQYALAAEKVMNLNKSTISSLQLETVEKYGQSIDAATRSTEQLRSVQREMLAMFHQSENQMHKTLATGQILADTFEAMRSGAIQSGAGIDHLNQAAALFYKTMAGGGAEGAPMYRPEMLKTLGQSAVTGLFPVLAGGIDEEIQRSQSDWLFLQRGGGIGRQVLEDLGANAADFIADPSKLLNLNLAQSKMLSDPEQADKWAQAYFAKMVGIADIYQDNPMKAQRLLSDRGMMPGTGELIFNTINALRARNFSTDKWSEENMKIAKAWGMEEQRTPQERELLENAGLYRNLMEIAKEQGDAQRSVMDTVADALTDISTHMGEYWDNFRRSVRSAFGIETPVSPVSPQTQREMYTALGMPAPPEEMESRPPSSTSRYAQEQQQRKEFLERETQVISREAIASIGDESMRMCGVKMGNN